MKVKFKNVCYLVRWHHSDPAKMGNRFTECSIVQFKGKNESEIARGLAECHELDMFCKNIGRKISLTKALASEEFSKPFRTAIWKAYFEMRHGCYE